MLDGKANIVEIMESVQGEGPWLGCRQLFIRFSGCNLHCRYCDTLRSKEDDLAFCQVEKAWGSKEFEKWENPVAISNILEIIRERNGKIHALSLTGGEPLLSASYIAQLAQAWGPERPPFYLETNGTLFEAMASIADCIDYVSMDIKLPGLTGQNRWLEHEQFLDCIKEKAGYVKIVVSKETTQEELVQASRLVQQRAPRFPIVLQPISDKEGKTIVVPTELYKYQSWALEEHDDIRIIPQTHRLLGFL
ncbi:7-carboxy-7-deazaguanine synthase QueE [Heliorestis acidaminivorans]|uniref:7-carboxy-7-deazaguanine synthase n=1 Tax=Heliorestis acidaminivorans TaxID=553427 RepID=A0A6I0F061_9FIRM|nr:7-carboxy-7-deazaguanine synthase QueE [Heliorestis acidaminivorans]KAB2954316.1 7-carboxy-7-deazaguanine synthase QueE [Heliorestis acidaminivorans]